MLVWFAAIGGVRRLWRPAAPVCLCGRVDPVTASNICWVAGCRDFWSWVAYFFASPGRGGALRRHGPFPDRGRSRLSWSLIGLSGAILNYAGQAAIAPAGAPTDGNIFYWLCLWAAVDADDCAGDGRHRDRQPVNHYRLLFDDPPGDVLLGCWGAGGGGRGGGGGGGGPPRWALAAGGGASHPWPDNRLSAGLTISLLPTASRSRRRCF